MTTPIICLLICCILPITMAWVCGYYRHSVLGSVDNKEPRQQSAELTGAGARSVAAQQNAWEALAVFTAALWATNAAGVSAESISTACMIFVVCRILHAVTYLANQDALRSIAFLTGYGTCMYMFYLALTI